MHPGREVSSKSHWGSFPNGFNTGDLKLRGNASLPHHFLACCCLQILTQLPDMAEKDEPEPGETTKTRRRSGQVAASVQNASSDLSKMIIVATRATGGAGKGFSSRLNTGGMSI